MPYPTNPVTMTISSANGGSFNFAPDFPLVTRGIERQSKHESSAGGIRRMRLQLRGFFSVNAHSELNTKYNQLKAVLNDSLITFVYNDGVNDIVNGQVYLDSYNEPEDWKQYDGEYQIQFHYFEKFTPNDKITASFVGSFGTINFTPLPTWHHAIKPNKADYHESSFSPSGARISSTGTITLEGEIINPDLSSTNAVVPSPNTLLAIMDSWEAILHYGGATTAGTLNYGSFSRPVYFDGIAWGAGIPAEFIQYTASFKYDLEAIVKLSVKQKFSRIHHFPTITEQPYCHTRQILFGNTSGQTVSYDINLQSNTVSNARSLLATELAVLLIPGGIELPGGVEDWDYNSASVHVQINQFHDGVVLSNI